MQRLIQFMLRKRIVLGCTIGNRYKDIPKHNILEHVLTTMDCYL